MTVPPANTEPTNPPAPVEPLANGTPAEPTNTPAEGLDNSEATLPPEVKAILAKNRAELREAQKISNANAQKIKEYEQRDMTEQQKLQAQRDELLAENNNLKIETLKRDVAAETGLNPALSKYLTGTTRDELEASAKELGALTTPKKPPFGDVGLGQGTKDPATGGRIYTKAEISNPKFFAEHKADIQLALRENRITE